MANYCPNCGSKLDENAKFCSNCGASTSAESQSEQREEGYIVLWIISLLSAVAGIYFIIQGYNIGIYAIVEGFIVNPEFRRKLHCPTWLGIVLWIGIGLIAAFQLYRPIILY